MNRLRALLRWLTASRCPICGVRVTGPGLCCSPEHTEEWQRW